MTTKNKILIGLFGVGVVAAAISPFFVSASPLYFPSTSKTATATSTLSYMTPGTATSTLAYDSYTAGDNFKTDMASLLVQTTASSSSAVFNISIEYSQDGIDWYQDNLSSFQASSTPGTTNVSKFNSLTFTAASSTIDGVLSNAPQSRVINVMMPTRFVRAVISVGIGSANGAVWAQWIPAKQIQGN